MIDKTGEILAVELLAYDQFFDDETRAALKRIVLYRSSTFASQDELKDHLEGLGITLLRVSALLVDLAKVAMPKIQDYEAALARHKAELAEFESQKIGLKDV